MKQKLFLILFTGIVAGTQAQNVGIGTTTPTLAGLVVEKNVGAVNAMFGSNSIGVAIEGNFPGIGLNSYYNNGRKAINTGYGSWVGLNPATGLLTIATSPTSITGQGTAMPLADRLNIKPDGNIGIQGNTDPQSPLSFANTLGDKINFYHVNATSNYGIGIQGSQMQIHAGGAGDAISFGYGNSNAFTENMRINGNGNVGIGGATPYKLTVTNTGDGIVQQDATGNSAIGFFCNSSTAYLQTRTNTSLSFATNNSFPQMQLSTAGNFKIGGGNVATERLEIAGSIKMVDGTQGANKVLVSDANGKGSWKNYSGNYFKAAFGSSTQSFANNINTKVYLTSKVDDGGNWNNSESKFVAPETGLYHFDISLLPYPSVATNEGNLRIILNVNGNEIDRTNARIDNSAVSLNRTLRLSWTCKLNSQDEVTMAFYQNARSTSLTLDNITQICGYRIN